MKLPSRPALPDLTRLRDRALPASRTERLGPLLFAGGLLWRWGSSC